jgi:transcriptional regulator with GAF, ATPase, and Fis domain
LCVDSKKTDARENIAVLHSDKFTESATSPEVKEIVGDSAAIRFAKECIDRVASSDAAILITGETGTGKELLAHRAHYASARNARPLISINCAAIPDALLESELFGFEKGAFTGAVSRQQGRLIQANGGTIFLDEIADLSPTAQAKLLRVLEEKTIQPLGGARAETVDMRVIAATNRDLQQLALDEKFRQDLYFRIGVIHVHVPPLRERREDIPLIANHFLQMLSRKYLRPIVTFTPCAHAYLRRQPWVGNVREPRNVIERAFLLSTSEFLTEDDVTGSSHLSRRSSVIPTYDMPKMSHTRPIPQPEHRISRSRYYYPKFNSSEYSERELLLRTLEEVKWNKSRAAKLLRCSRMTIHRKLAHYNLRKQAFAGLNLAESPTGPC